MTDEFVVQVDPRPDDEPWPVAVWPPTVVALEGETVRLTPTVDADLAELREALDDERVWRHIPIPPPVDVDGMRDLLALVKSRGLFPWTLRLVQPVGGFDVGAVVGWSSYLEVNDLDARCEIGLTSYAVPVWGTNVNPEAKLLLLTHAFEHLQMGRVQLKADVRNTRSQGAIARLGAKNEGVLRRYQRRADGTVRDSVMFSVTAEDWPDVKARLTARLR